MDKVESEEVMLEVESEPEPMPEPASEPAPVPEPAQVESDPAAEAFAQLEGELALMRRAVQHLAAERADIVNPDYGATLANMNNRLGAISGSLEEIAGHPAMRVTPDSFGSRIEAAAEAARRGDQAWINDAYRELGHAAQDMRAFTSNARKSVEQRRQIRQSAGGGVIAGILLWSFLPGTIARAVPESWHWPERMASKAVGRSSRWEAGARLMQSESAEAWRTLEQAADLLHNNRGAIEACQKSAATSGKLVGCTVKVQTKHQIKG